MAALTRHAFISCILTKSLPVVIPNTNALLARCISKRIKKPCQKPKKKATIESIMSSIEAKGFLRPYKPYSPPPDVSERLDKICETLEIDTNDSTQVTDLALRFKLFSECANEFQYYLPNSRLDDIKTVGDLREFYKTPVITTTPYDALQNIDLPPNLHVQKDYVRFHPDTDKAFGGKTAFPQSATLVTGLKYKNKYQGHQPEKPWPAKVHTLFED